MRWFAGVAVVVLVFIARGAGAADPTLAWFRFEDGQIGQVVSGNTQVTDSGPCGLHGWTPYNCRAQRVAGIAPGSKAAWDISAIDDWFLVPDDPRLATDGSLTLEAWVKIRGYQRTAVSNFILFRGDSTPGWDAYCLGLHPNGNLFFHIEGPGQRQGEPPPTVECPFLWFGAAVHVAGVFDADKGTLSLYVNGDRVGSMSTHVRPRVRLSPAMGPGLGVGGYHGGNASSFALDGIVDEVRVSGAALEPAALLCGELPRMGWLGTKGYEADGFEPASGSTATPFLFAVRCARTGDAAPELSLELRAGGQVRAPVPMTRAQALPGSRDLVYRARVELGPGKWEYRCVGVGVKGEPLCWQPGPVVSPPSDQ